MISARRRRRVCFQNGADDEEQGTHTHCGGEQRPPPSKGFDPKEDEDCGCDYFDDAWIGELR